MQINPKKILRACTYIKPKIATKRDRKASITSYERGQDNHLITS